MTQLTIEDVKQKFSIWRQSAKRCQKIPKYLVDDAKELSKYCNRNTLLKELNIHKSNWAAKEIIKFQEKYLNSLDINILKSSHINFKYPKILKKEILSQFKQGTKISELSKKFNMPDSTIYNWIRKKHKKKYKKGELIPINQINIKLFKDIYHIFKENKINKITTLDLIFHLCKDQYWSNYNKDKQNKKILPNQLAKHLLSCNIRSKTIKFEMIQCRKNIWRKGFEIGQFEETWKTYNISRLPSTCESYPIIQSYRTGNSRVPFKISRYQRLPLKEHSTQGVCNSAEHYSQQDQSPKNLKAEDFEKYLQQFDNVIIDSKYGYKCAKLKDFKRTEDPLKKTDNYIFITKFLCSLFVSLLFFKLSYFEMLSIFSISYCFFSLMEYFIKDYFVEKI